MAPDIIEDIRTRLTVQIGQFGQTQRNTFRCMWTVCIKPSDSSFWNGFNNILVNRHVRVNPFSRFGRLTSCIGWCSRTVPSPHIDELFCWSFIPQTKFIRIPCLDWRWHIPSIFWRKKKVKKMGTFSKFWRMSLPFAFWGGGVGIKFKICLWWEKLVYILSPTNNFSWSAFFPKSVCERDVLNTPSTSEFFLFGS